MQEKNEKPLPNWLESVVAREEEAIRQVEAIVNRKPELMSVAERFVSINGEGQKAGQLSAFIRFAGCNLRCVWCDTVWAQSAYGVNEWRTPEELVEWVKETKTECVTLTGGEPLMQPLVAHLVGLLLNLEDRELYVEVETNGSLSVRPLVSMRNEAHKAGSDSQLSITLDCKLPGSGEGEAMIAENYELLKPYDSVKFVIATDDDLDAMLDIIRERDLETRTQVLISPAFGVMDPARIVEFMTANSLTEARLQLQLHKVIWPGVDRGV